MLPLVNDHTEHLGDFAKDSLVINRRTFVKAVTSATALLASGSVGLTGCATRWAKHRRPGKGTYDTIAHEMLDIEQEHGKISNSYVVLDSFINVAKDVLSTERGLTDQDERLATLTLETIGKLLEVFGFTYKKTALLTEALDSRKIDCDGYSFVYLAVGEVMGFPIRMVRAPSHTFVRWHFSDTQYINWETTVRGVKDDDYYIISHKIDPSAVGISAMRSLDVIHNRDQILANAFVNSGVEWLKKMKFERSIDRFDEAIKRDPYYEAPYYNKGLVYYHLGDMANAVEWCEKAVALNPNHMKSHAVLGTAYMELKDSARARMHFKRVQELDPEYYASKITEMRLSELAPPHGEPSVS